MDGEGKTSEEVVFVYKTWVWVRNLPSERDESTTVRENKSEIKLGVWMEQEDLEIEVGLSSIARPGSKNLVHFFYKQSFKSCADNVFIFLF